MTSEQSMFKAEDFLEHIRKSKSKNTYNVYKYALKKFSAWYGKTLDEILEERRQDWISGDLVQKKRLKLKIEEWHRWLLNHDYSQNAARSLVTNFIQLFRFFEMPITDLPTEVTQKVPTTKDYIPSRDEYRRMYEVSSDLRGKLIISLGKDLGWRIGDFAKIRKDAIPDLDQEAPIPFELITEKEKVIAKSFLSQETCDLLKDYIPTLNPDNSYLFQSNTNGYYTEESINRTLRDLAEKAQIKIPQNKRLRFHCFRKRFLSECANASIDINIAKILTGKDVEESMLAYLSEVEHREAFIKVHERLRLTETPMRKTKLESSELEKRVEELERLVHGVIALGGKELVEKAKLALNLNVATMTKQQLTEALVTIGDKERKEQRKEYARLIAENNNNNNH